MMLPDERPATTADMRRLADLFIHRLLEIVEDPEATTSQLNVVRQFLADAKIDFKSGQERNALRDLIDSYQSEQFVPFIDPISRKRY